MKKGRKQSRKSKKPFKSCFFALSLLFSSLLPAQAADVYKNIANEIYAAAKEAGIKNIAISNFRMEGLFGNEKTSYPADKISEQLSMKKGINVIERGRLEDVFKEIKISYLAGNHKNFKKVFKSDALITGTIYEGYTATEMSVKLIDLESAKVLVAKTVKIEDFPQTFGRMDAPEFDISAPSFSSFRDAPADSPTNAEYCAAQRAEIKKMQEETLEMKARYWAFLLRTPGFSYKNITRNPGSEFFDPARKNEFYQLLNQYWKKFPTPQITPSEREKVKYVIKKEKEYKDNCGEG